MGLRPLKTTWQFVLPIRPDRGFLALDFSTLDNRLIFVSMHFLIRMQFQNSISISLWLGIHKSISHVLFLLLFDFY